MSTRERIVYEALVLFSKKGYSDVYVAEIASAVGIKAPSLYKHFKSKQDIFDKYCVEDLNVPSLVFQSEDDRLSDYDKAVAGAYRLPECTFVSFKNGGHLLEGHDNEIRAAVCEFCKK